MSPSASIPQIFPAPGWVEHDPEDDLGDASWASRRRLLPKAGVGASGCRRHRHHEPARDDGRLGPRDGQAHPPTRSSGRTAAPPPICDALRAPGHEPTIRARTGLRARRLLLRHEDRVAARQRARRARSAPSAASSPSARSTRWLVWQLTGGAVHVTDATNASRTLLFNIHDAATGTTSCSRVLDVPRALLPEVVPSQRRLRRDRGLPRRRARSRSPASRATSRRRSSGRRASRRAWRRTPTAPAASCCMNTGEQAASLAQPPAHDGRLATGERGATIPTRSRAASSSPARRCSGCATAWASSRDAAEVEALARERPRQRTACTSCRRSSASARRTGTRRARRDRRAHARHDGGAPRPRDPRERSPTRARTLVEAMDADSALALTELRVDGGAAANDLLMQFQADLLGIRRAAQGPGNHRLPALHRCLVVGLSRRRDR